MSELVSNLIRVIRETWHRCGDCGDKDTYDHIADGCAPCCALDLCDEVENDIENTRAAHPAVEDLLTDAVTERDMQADYAQRLKAVLDELEKWLACSIGGDDGYKMARADAVHTLRVLRAAKGV